MTAHLEADKQHLTDVVTEIFADRPRIDLLLAIGAGHRALERGTPFFDAVAIAEGVRRKWEEVVRNCERLVLYRIKRSTYDRHDRLMSGGRK